MEPVKMRESWSEEERSWIRVFERHCREYEERMERGETGLIQEVEEYWGPGRLERNVYGMFAKCKALRAGARDIQAQEQKLREEERSAQELRAQEEAQGSSFFRRRHFSKEKERQFRLKERMREDARSSCERELSNVQQRLDEFHDDAILRKRQWEERKRRWEERKRRERDERDRVDRECKQREREENKRKAELDEHLALMRKATLKKRVELDNPYCHTALSSSPTRFRLLKLRPKRMQNDLSISVLPEKPLMPETPQAPFMPHPPKCELFGDTCFEDGSFRGEEELDVREEREICDVILEALERAIERDQNYRYNVPYGDTLDPFHYALSLAYTDGATKESLKKAYPTQFRRYTFEELRTYFQGLLQRNVERRRRYEESQLLFLQHQATYLSDLSVFEAQLALFKEQNDLYKRYEGSLFCSMSTFDLNSPDCPHFEALSYEWNANMNKGRKRIIMQDGAHALSSIEIGYNLWDFLRHIQQEDDEFWVWTDALCINQNSLAERGHQVRLMGKIYSEADRVLAWLPVQDPGRYSNALEQIRAVSRGATLTKHVMNGGRLIDDLNDLFRLSYWTRKWIIQEVLLARTVVLQLGRFDFPMQDLEDALAFLGGAGPSAFDSTPVSRLAAHRRNRRQGKTFPRALHELIRTYQSNQCSEPFDHVYALYNLIGVHKENFKIAYGQELRAWLYGVLAFLDSYEQSSRKFTTELALILSRMIGGRHHCSTAPLTGEAAVTVTTTVFDRGVLDTREDCANSMHLRQNVSSLHPGTIATFKKSPECWRLSNVAESRTLQVINRRVLGYFEIPGQPLCGLAAARIKRGDHVWQFLNTKFGFIVRFDEGVFKLLGRCYLFHLSGGGTDTIPSMATLSSDQNHVGLPTYDLRLNVSDLLTLAYIASDVDFPNGPSPGAELSRMAANGLASSTTLPQRTRDDTLTSRSHSKGGSLTPGEAGRAMLGDEGSDLSANQPWLSPKTLKRGTNPFRERIAARGSPHTKSGPYDDPASP